MILGLEIAMLIWGIIALSTGKLTISKTKVVRGTRARLLGVVLILPLPAALTVGFAIGFMSAAGGGNTNLDSLRWTITGVEAAIVLLCLIAAVAGGVMLGRSPDDSSPVA